MEDIDAPSTSERKGAEVEISEEPPQPVEVRKKRKKKKHSSSLKDEEIALPDLSHDEVSTFENLRSHLQLVGMPEPWVSCKTVMAWWLLITFLIVGLSIVTIPIGCILAFFACFLYFSQKGTREQFGGKHVSRTVYLIALLAWMYDMLIFGLTLMAWVILVFGVYKDYDENILQFRLSVGYFVAAQMCMVFLHAAFSFAAYLKLRDCCHDIILDEKEARERFADMEKQIFEEFRRKRKSDTGPKKKKKSSKTKKHHS